MDNPTGNSLPSLERAGLQSTTPVAKERRKDALIEKIKSHVNLSPESARIWAEEQMRSLDVDDFDESFILEHLIDFFDSPKGSELRIVLDFLLPLFELSEFSEDMLYHQFEEKPIPRYSKIDLGYLKMIMGAFPHIWGHRYSGGLLKVSQVAKMLHISEAKVRELANEGKLKSTRSQGDTGHYRFRPEWVLEYSNEPLGINPE